MRDVVNFRTAVCAFYAAQLIVLNYVALKEQEIVKYREVISGADIN